MLFPRSKFFASLLLTVSLVQLCPAQWVSANGTGGDNIRSLSANKKLVCAVTDSSRFLISYNEGVTWEEPYSFIGTPVNEVTAYGDGIFAATDSGLFKSVDNGGTWVKKKSGIEGRSVWALCRSNDTLYASLFNGLARSTDGGETWSFPFQAMDTIDLGAIMVANGKIFGASNDGLVVSIDGGETWALSHLATYEPIISCFCKAGTVLFAGTYGQGVFRSMNNGDTWEDVSIGLNANINDLCFSDSIVFAGTQKGYNGNIAGMYSSSDMGTTWALCNTGLPNMYGNALAVTENAVLVGAIGEGIFRTVDHGGHWYSVRNSLSAQSISHLLTVGNSLLVGTLNSGIWRKELNNDCWSNLNAGLERTEINGLCATPTALFCIGLDELYRSFDGAYTWEPLRLYSRGIAAVDMNLVAALSYDSIGISRDNGDTWQIDTMSNGYLRPFSFSGGLGVTTSDNEFRSFRVTIDTGNTWFRPDSLFPENPNGIKALAAKNGLYINSPYNGFFVSHDTGKTWLSIGYPELLNSMISAGNVVLAGGNGNVYSLGEGDSAWTSIGSGLPSDPVVSLCILDDTIYAGTYSTGLWKVNKPSYVTSLNDKSASYSHSEDFIRVYEKTPNHFEFRFYSNSTQGIMDIYSVNGKCIFSRSLQKSNSDCFVSEFDAQNFAPGIYLVAMRGDNRVITNSIIIH